jgi:hypothetical protein
MYFDYKAIEHLPKQERLNLIEEARKTAEKEQDYVQLHSLECILNAELFID